MKLDLALKLKIKAHCLSEVGQKIAKINTAIQGLKESRSNDTKSSAGDKFETGRAMLDQEIDKQFSVLLDWEAKQTRIEQTKLDNYLTAQPGALIKANSDYYFILESLGRIQIDGLSVFCLSINAPIAKLLIGKKEGDSIKFGEKSITINSIV
jgi:hypothetical protein